MGPPIFIGGNIRTYRCPLCRHIASMGPPIFIGGNKAGSRRRCACTAGFNGAADFHRRKLPNVGTVEGGALASMGPPIFIGGNLGCASLQASISVSFNGAADFHRRK